MGISRTFQNINLFDSMTVLENVIVGQHSTTKAGLWDAIVRSARFKEEGDVTRRKAEELVEFVGLGDDMNEIAKNLPYGKQKRLEIARVGFRSPAVAAGRTHGGPESHRKGIGV